MKWEELLQHTSVNEHDLDEALRVLPKDALDFLSGPEVLGQIGTKKIQAIKAIRERFGVGLKLAKDIADFIHQYPNRLAAAKGAPVVSESLVTAVEALEDGCRAAIQLALGNDRAIAALIGLRRQFNSLWMDLVGVSDPEE